MEGEEKNSQNYNEYIAVQRVCILCFHLCDKEINQLSFFFFNSLAAAYTSAIESLGHRVAEKSLPLILVYAVLELSP